MHVVHHPPSSHSQLQQQEQRRGDACEAPAQPAHAPPAAARLICARSLVRPGVIDRAGRQDQGLGAHGSASLAVSRVYAALPATVNPLACDDRSRHIIIPSQWPESVHWPGMGAFQAATRQTRFSFQCNISVARTGADLSGKDSLANTQILCRIVVSVRQPPFRLHKRCSWGLCLLTSCRQALILSHDSRY